MKTKTSISLSDDLIRDIDCRSSSPGKRSDFIEHAVRAYISMTDREKSNKRDARIINRNAGRLNREADDVLGFQAGA